MFTLLKFVIILLLSSPTFSIENWNQILDEDVDTSNWINPNDMGFDVGVHDSRNLKRLLKPETAVKTPQIVEAGDIYLEIPVEEYEPGNNKS